MRSTHFRPWVRSTLAFETSMQQRKDDVADGGHIGRNSQAQRRMELAGEYAWTQYSRIGEIVVESAAFSTTGNRTALLTDWRDQHNVRVGAEYLAMAWPIRYGYGFTSTVTNSDYARASFTPPGPAHTLTLGYGKRLCDGRAEALRFDAGFEYTMTFRLIRAMARRRVQADCGNRHACGNILRQRIRGSPWFDVRVLSY
jgi:hypothetical protein